MPGLQAHGVEAAEETGRLMSDTDKPALEQLADWHEMRLHAPAPECGGAPDAPLTPAEELVIVRHEMAWLRGERDALRKQNVVLLAACHAARAGGDLSGRPYTMVCEAIDLAEKRE